MAESKITVDDLIQPIFIKENLSGYEPIQSMPNINRLGANVLEAELRNIVDTGIKAVALFRDRRSKKGFSRNRST